MATDLTGVVSEMQQHSRLAAAIQQALVKGVAIIAADAQYAFANLPATAATGTRAYCTNGRKPGEGVGAGTGVPVWFDTSGHWFSYCSGAQVTD